MSTEIDAYPLCWPAGWPRSVSREYGQFKGSLDTARRGLLHEINLLVLGAQSRNFTVRHQVVISTNFPLRKDGEIYASAKEPTDPGVAVYFWRKKKQVCMACDKYDRVWKNVRGLQNTIEALRGIERWGSSQLLDRAFTGFTALPESTGPRCWEVLGIDPPAGSQTEREIAVIAAFRAKAHACHPDVAGGSHEAFLKLNQAKDIALQLIKS